MPGDICFASWEYETNDEWKKNMEPHLQRSRSFEIHCWSDEREAIDIALTYGHIKPYDWEYGTVIEGAVTPEFIQMLLTYPKPADVEVYNKMTPFFTIHLDDGFWSEHYGTELNEE